MTTPVLPTLRAIVGQMMMRLSTATTTNRGLAVLTGALSDADVVVQNAINALSDAVDAMPEETVTRGKASVKTAFVDYEVVVGGATETAWSMDLGSGVSAAYIFEFDICAVSDDGLDHSTYKWFHSVQWDGSSVAQLAAPASVISVESSPASSSCTSDISSTTIRIRVNGTAEWRYGGTVRVTKMEF